MKRKSLNEQAMSSLAQIERQAGEMAKGLSDGAMEMKGEVESGGFLDTIAGFFRSIGIVDPCDFVEKNRSELEGQERELTVVMDKLRALESGQVNDGLTTLATIVGGLGAGSLGYYAYKKYEPRLNWAVEKGKSTLETLQNMENLKSGGVGSLVSQGIDKVNAAMEGSEYVHELGLQQLLEIGPGGSMMDPADHANARAMSRGDADKYAQFMRDTAKAKRDGATAGLKALDPTALSSVPDHVDAWKKWMDGEGSGWDVALSVPIPFFNPAKGIAKGAKALAHGRKVYNAKVAAGVTPALANVQGGVARRIHRGKSLFGLGGKVPGVHKAYTSVPGSIVRNLSKGEISAIQQASPLFASALRFVDKNPNLVNAVAFGGYKANAAAVDKLREKLNELEPSKRKAVTDYLDVRFSVPSQHVASTAAAATAAMIPALGNPSEAWFSVGKAMVITAGLLLVYRALVKLAPGPLCSIKEFIVDIGSSIASGISSLYDSFVQPVVDYIRDLAASAWESLSSMFSRDDEMAPVTEAYRVIKEWNDINDSMTIFNISSRVLV